MKLLRTCKNIVLMVLVCFACSEEFLDKKPDKSIVVPAAVEELQALLDNSRIMNNAPGLGVIGSDDVMMDKAAWEGLPTAAGRNGYLWAQDVYEGEENVSDWTVPYEQIFYANVVLDELSEFEESEEWKQVRGRALFYRAFSFFELAQLFCAPYKSDDLNSPGIPLKLTADVDASVFRATVKDTYSQIVKDLEEAVMLLPEQVQVQSQPGRAAGHAMLARVYLSMTDYEKAEEHATSALEIYGTLLDYNDLNAAASRPFTRLHDEVLYHASMLSYSFLSSRLTYIDSTLIKQYHSDDLRRSIFFTERGDNLYTFKGSYTGDLRKFGGISNNEVYLTRAECRVRNGNTPGALADLNTLLEKRWIAGTYTPITEEDPEELLVIILNERRKELVFRNNRWTDLRRLNQDPRFAKTLTRDFDGQSYSLPPNDLRYVYPIPYQEIMHSGISQNPR